MTSQPEIEIGNLLRQRGQTLAIAESCTGGMVSHRITNVPGSSDYFLGSIVAYSNEIKESLLGVARETLEKYGAVSREVVLEMALGGRHMLKADIVACVSGIAGPGGGTPEKPVGTTWVGLATPEGAWARCFQFKGERENNKAAAAQATLQMLLDFLEGKRTLDKE